jgi:hypothetical protein
MDFTADSAGEVGGEVDPVEFGVGEIRHGVVTELVGGAECVMGDDDDIILDESGEALAVRRGRQCRSWRRWP